MFCIKSYGLVQEEAMARISKIGNSLGVTLSREALAIANLRLRDEVVLVPVQDGIFMAAASSPQGAMLAAVLEDMNARPDLYRKLAE
jgi:putative addiction module antidote